MIKADVHIHSEFSTDSDAKVFSMVERAIALKLDYICFTDHYDMDFGRFPEEKDSFQLDTEKYLQVLRECKLKYGSRINLLMGVELGVMGYLKDRILAYLKKYEFDFVIASSHLVNGEDPYYESFFEGKIEKEAYREYFESILENVQKIEDYNIYGHLDYVVRYGPTKNKYFKFQDYEDIFREILRIIIQKGKGIEINTSGLYKNLGYAHPHKDILKLYKDLGGKIITVGSDAHSENEIAYGFNEVAGLLKELGFKYYAVFIAKKPRFFKL